MPKKRTTASIFHTTAATQIMTRPDMDEASAALVVARVKRRPVVVGVGAFAAGIVAARLAGLFGSPVDLYVVFVVAAVVAGFVLAELLHRQIVRTYPNMYRVLPSGTGGDARLVFARRGLLERIREVEALRVDGLVADEDWDALRWRLWETLDLSTPSQMSVGWVNIAERCEGIIADARQRTR